MKNYQFKLGQRYMVISSELHMFKIGKIYEVIERAGVLGIQSESGLLYREYDLSFLGLELGLIVEPDPKKQPFTPTIEIDFLIDYIEANHLESNEIISFLKGHKKGQEFIHETLK